MLSTILLNMVSNVTVSASAATIHYTFDDVYSANVANTVSSKYGD